ncbi:MAG: hypothetical protein ACC660_05275, partial [Acidimicrobiales bacterium]
MGTHAGDRRRLLIFGAGLVAALAGLVAVLASVGSMAGAGPLGPDVIAAPDARGAVGPFTSMVLDNSGNPIISYYDDSNDDLKVLHCTNTDCSGTQTPQSPDTAGSVGFSTSIALDNSGNPIISYYDGTN